MFDHTQLTRLRVVLNSTQQFPEREYQCKFSTAEDDYARVYEEFLRAGLREHDVDQGSIVSLDTFKSLYPIFCIDLSEQYEKSVQVENSLLEIYWSNEMAATDYYAWVCVEAERQIELATSEGSMKFIKVVN